tara:strand:+ start:1048 stop:1350 length:303 start_codon:yes stop_codon:yes gene_type:complete
MKYSLHIQDSAFMDVAEGVEYYEAQREGLSLDFELCLEEGYWDILSTPLGYEVKYANIRIKFIRRFPYGIHYFVDNTDVYVISVFHTSKNPKRWFERIKN